LRARRVSGCKQAEPHEVPSRTCQAQDNAQVRDSGCLQVVTVNGVDGR
jgi:hypothetical protein